MTVDLRTDTMAKPTQGMRRAMAAAEVGHDAHKEDPTVNALQEKAASMFEMEASLFMPSGTMANLVAVTLHTQPGDEVILESTCHIYNMELSNMATFAGVLPRPISAEDGILPLDRVEEELKPHPQSPGRTGLITIENTHNRRGGVIYPLPVARELLELAHSRSIPVHIDGARIFNAAVASGLSVAGLTEGFDSAIFAMSKGLGAPVGSMLLGQKEFIKEARIVRKRLGGGMAKPGILAAAGIYALDHHIDRLEKDHEHAKLLAKKLQEVEGIKLIPEEPPTNIVVSELSDNLGIDAYMLIERLSEGGLLARSVSHNRIRMVTHMGVEREDVLKAAKIIKEVLNNIR